MNDAELACRIALAGLVKIVEKICDENCKKPERIPEYNQAKELLDGQSLRMLE